MRREVSSEHLRAAHLAVAGGLLAWLALCAFARATTMIDPYDGAHHTVLARNLAFGGRYGLWDYGRWVVWPLDVSVGPTLIVPLALGFRLAGWGPFVPNVVCATLSVGLASVLWLLVARRAATPTAMLSSVAALALLLTTTVKGFEYFFLPYGEVMAGFLCALATVVALGAPGVSPVRAWSAGALAGLALGDKFLALLPGVCLAVALARVTGSRRVLALFIAGVVSVFVPYEVLKLVQLGSVLDYGTHWVGFARYLFQHAGSGLLPRGSLLLRLSSHAQLLVGHLRWLILPFGLVLAAWPALACRSLRPAATPETRVAAALGLEVVVLLFWWLAISGLPWPRYAVIPLLLLPVYAHFALVALEGAGARGVLVVPGWLLLVAIAAAVSPRGTVVPPTPSRALTPRTAAVFEVADEIRRRPSARFWGSGWWRHWDVQTLVDVRLADLLGPDAPGGPEGGPDYLITSDFFDLEKNPRTVAVVRENAEHRVFRNGYFTIYELKPPGG